jgi:hypothetical protein
MIDEETSALVRRAAASGTIANVKGAMVSAALIRELLTAEGSSRSRAVALRRAQVVGDLDLGGASLTCALHLLDCTITGQLVLVDTSATRIEVRGGSASRVISAGVRLSGDLSLSHGFASPGGIFLNRARIDGRLILSGAVLGERAGVSLQAPDIKIGAELEARSMWTDGRVELVNCDIGGHLALNGSHLRATETVLNLQRARIGGSLFLRDGFQSTGQVSLALAKISGGVTLRDSRLFAPPNALPTTRQLNLEGASLGGDLTLACSSVEGHMTVIGSRIAGDIAITETSVGSDHLARHDLDALSFDRARVDGNLNVADGSLIRGSLSIRGALVGGQVVLAHALLSVPSGTAFNADTASIDGSLFCLDGLTVDGEFRMVGARIKSQFGMRRCRFDNPGGKAINASESRIGASVLLQSGCVVTGELDLTEAEIGSMLVVTNAQIRGEPTAMNLGHTSIRQALLLLPATIVGTVDLTQCVTTVFVDRPACWPAQLRLTGFQYEAIDSRSTSAASRLAWLTRATEGYSPQPYEQLTAAYRLAGWEEDARTVEIAKRRRRRAELSLMSRLWDILLDVGIGYGYATWRAAVGLLVLAIAGSLVFTAGYPEHFTAAKPSATLPPFHAITYTLDVLVPVISLRQRDAWTPDGYALIWSVALTFAGWVLTTAVVATLTGLLRRD